MYTPSQADVRLFFCEASRKAAAGLPLSALEALAADWAVEHPEYRPDLADATAALGADYRIEDGRTNPFLHLSMHLSISEQVAIDQPRGISQAYQLLLARRGSAHAAQHDVMECLGDMLWTSQRTGLPPDGDRYIDCVRRKATAG